MELDWAEVERLVKPSPNYADIPRRLLDVLAYGFVRKHYNHNMSEAQAYAARLLGSDPRRRYGAMLDEITRTFQRLHDLGVSSTQEFILSVENRQKLEEFYTRTQFPLDSLIGVLHYLLYWVLPARIYLRELVEPEDQQQLAYVTALRESGGALQPGHARNGVHPPVPRPAGAHHGRAGGVHPRPDQPGGFYPPALRTRQHGAQLFQRWLYQPGKTGTGRPRQVQADMDRYAASIGKNLKHGMELDSGIVIAGILPKIVK